MKVKKIMNNFIKIEIFQTTFYISYETCVAFENKEGLYVSENVWSRTTGKHLNQIEPDKSKRIPNEEFEQTLLDGKFFD